MYEQIGARDDKEFSAPGRPNVQANGRKVLRAALKNSAAQDQSINALWEVFRDFVREYECAEVIAVEVRQAKAELVEAVRRDFLPELMTMALMASCASALDRPSVVPTRLERDGPLTGGLAIVITAMSAITS